ncbi:MAG: restriction endonuclease subunit S [Bacteroidota bacterium]
MGNIGQKRWVYPPLKELTSFVIGGDWGKDPIKESSEDFGKVFCIRGSEFKNWKKEKGETASLRKIKKASLEKRKLKKGDVLLEISGGGPDQPVGRTVIIDDETLEKNHGIPKVCTNFFRLVRFYENLNKEFLNYYLQYFYHSGEVVKYQGGSNNLRNLKFKEYETIKIPLAPLPEQNRIVAKLDKLFEQLEMIDDSLEKIPVLLKNFRQQVLSQAVTGKLTEEWRKGKKLEEWRVIHLDKLLIDTPKNGAYYPKSKYGDGVRIIRIDAFYEGRLKYWEKVQKVRISEKDFEIYSLKEGNILINRVNSIDYLGKCMLVENLLEPAIFESNMMRLTINNAKANPSYLRYFLTSIIGKKELRKNAKHAVNQASINQTDVKSVLVNIPGIEEQKEIVARIESLFQKADVIEEQYRILKKKIDNLPQTILHKAFKGELVPQLESDGDARELMGEIAKIKKSSKI